jgi:hypothetical protein
MGALGGKKEKVTSKVIADNYVLFTKTAISYSSESQTYIVYHTLKYALVSHISHHLHLL